MGDGDTTSLEKEYKEGGFVSIRRYLFWSDRSRYA